MLPVIFPEYLTSGQLYYSDVMILFDLLYYVWTILKALIAQHYFAWYILKFNKKISINLLLLYNFMSVVLPFLLRLVRVICLIIFEAKLVFPFAYFLFHHMCRRLKQKWPINQYTAEKVRLWCTHFFFLLELNKIYNTLHLLFFIGYTYKI